MIDLAQLIKKSRKTVTLMRGESYLVTKTIDLPTGPTNILVEGVGPAPKIVSQMSKKLAAFNLSRGVTLQMGHGVEWDLTKGGVGIQIVGGSALLTKPLVRGGHFIDAKEWDIVELDRAGQLAPLDKYFFFGGDLYTTPIKGCACRAVLTDCNLNLGSKNEALVRWMRGHVTIRRGRYISGAPGKQTIQGRGATGLIDDVVCDGSIDLGPLPKSATRDHLIKGLRTKAVVSGGALRGEVKAQPGTEALIERLNIVGRDPRGGGSNSAIVAANFKHLDRAPAVVYVCNSAITNTVADDRDLATAACHLGIGNKVLGDYVKPDGNWNEAAVNQIRKAVVL